MVLQSKANELHYNPGDERDGIFWLPNREGGEWYWQDADLTDSVVDTGN